MKLKVQRFLLFLDKTTTTIAGALKTLGRRYLDPWLVPSQEDAPKRTPELRYYREIELAIRFFQDRFSWEYLMKVKRKQLYWDTIDTIIPPPLYRSVTARSGGSNVFKRLPKYPVKTAVKDFFVKFHMEVLPVKPWLEQKGFLVPWSTNCELCPVQESLQHVFLYCTNAELFWAELRVVFEADLYPTWEHLKFLESGRTGHRECYDVLMLLGLYAIWRSRMDHTLVSVKGKPAWSHFIEAFTYVSAVTQATEKEEYNHWASLHKRLAEYTQKQKSIKSVMAARCSFAADVV